MKGLFPSFVLQSRNWLFLNISRIALAVYTYAWACLSVQDWWFLCQPRWEAFCHVVCSTILHNMIARQSHDNFFLVFISLFFPLRRRRGTELSYDQILKAVEGSLARMKCSYIDLLQLHWPDRYVPLQSSSKFSDVLYDYRVIACVYILFLYLLFQLASSACRKTNQHTETTVHSDVHSNSFKCIRGDRSILLLWKSANVDETMKDNSPWVSIRDLTRVDIYTRQMHSYLTARALHN